MAPNGPSIEEQRYISTPSQLSKNIITNASFRLDFIFKIMFYNSNTTAVFVSPILKLYVNEKITIFFLNVLNSVNFIPSFAAKNTQVSILEI